MKKTSFADKLLTAILIGAGVVLTLYSTYIFLDWKLHPDLYYATSFPWYISILIAAGIYIAVSIALILIRILSVILPYCFLRDEKEDEAPEQPVDPFMAIFGPKPEAESKRHAFGKITSELTHKKIPPLSRKKTTKQKARHAKTILHLAAKKAIHVLMPAA